MSVESTWVRCFSLTSPCPGAAKACAASKEELSQRCLYLGRFLISGMQENRAHLGNIRWLLFRLQDLLGWVGAETHQVQSPPLRRANITP